MEPNISHRFSVHLMRKIHNFVLFCFSNVSEPVKGPATVVAAELQAAARAIRDAARMGITNLHLFTNSETVCDAQDNIPKYKLNNWRKYNEHKKQWERVNDRSNFELFDNALSNNTRVAVKFIHVAGNAGNQHNQGANRLAKEGAKIVHPN